MPVKGGGKVRAGGVGRGGASGGRGRSAASPGHLKREAGAQSARDFAPGRLNRDIGEADDVLDGADERAEPSRGLLDRLFGRR